MSKILLLGRAGSINRERVVAIARARSAPILRMIQATDPSRVLNMTYGYPRRSVMVLDNGFIVLSSRTPEELAKALGLCQELNNDEDPPPWW